MARKTVAPHPSPPPLGEVLRHYREKAGWTQTELEQEAGLKPTAVSKLERGVHHLSRQLAERLVRILGFPEGAVDQALAAIDQLPRLAPQDDSPTALSRSEHGAIEGMVFSTTRRLATAVRTGCGAALLEKRWLADRKAAARAWKKLSPAPQEERLVRVAHLKDFQTWAVCERLCFESIRAASHDADRARALAELALSVAERSPGSEAWRNVLTGFALAFVANAWRVIGDFQTANRTMKRCEELFRVKEGEAGPLDPTRVLDIRAVLKKYQRLYEEALAILDEAFAIAVPRRQLLLCGNDN